MSIHDEVLVNDILTIVHAFDRALHVHDESVAFRACRLVIRRKHHLTPLLVQTILSRLLPQESSLYQNLNRVLEQITHTSVPIPMEITTKSTPLTDLYALLALAASLTTSTNTVSTPLLRDFTLILTETINKHYSIHETLPIIGRLHFYHFLLLSRANLTPTQIKDILMVSYRASVHARDAFGRAVIINSILHCFAKEKQYSSISRFLHHCDFPMGMFPAQDSKFFYYSTLVSLISLEYSEALEKGLMSLRKAPATASTFRPRIQKLIILTQLLIGATPSRSLFKENDLKVPLFAYFCLVKAVRSGSLIRFKEVVARFSSTFERDGLLTVVERLRSSVVRLGLKNVMIAYSKVTIPKVKEILGISEESDVVVQGIIAKAIRDGVVAAKLDDGVVMREDSELTDRELNVNSISNRISFALSLKEEAFKSLRYAAGVEVEEFDLDEMEKERKAEQEARKHAEASADTYGEPGTGGW
ncbi:hypothetical protein GEMRC1_010325 [Eukaryota sp. GEM-RC1]